MRVLPILFNTEMVRANLDGRKTCTRRLVSSRQFLGMLPDKCKNTAPDEFLKGKRMMFKPYCDMTDAELIMTAYKAPYEPGDILYVRETWCALPVNEAGHMRGHSVYYYKADGDLRPEGWRGKWEPSIHMPKEAARIWLKITDVRVERLQEITPQGAWKEGARCSCLHPVPDCAGNKTAFVNIWNNTIKKSDLERYGWYANPWVWVIEFGLCDKPSEPYQQNGE